MVSVLKQIPPLGLNFLSPDGKVNPTWYKWIQSLGTGGFLLAANNLSDVANTATALANLGGVSSSSIIDPAHGGTGINNGTRTLTITGNNLQFTLSGATNVTLPTSGTLVNTAVTTLSSLVSIGTISTGVWNGTAVGVQWGGTGLATTTAYGIICGGTTATGNFQNAGTGATNTVLHGNGASALPTFSGVALADHTALAAHSVIGNTTGSSATPTAVATSNFVQQVVVQTFTSSGTYTPTTGMIYCTIECVGGGGGGGGVAVSTDYGSAGGGGAGGYSRKTTTAATVGASQTVTIGAAGSAGTAGNNAGGNGGDTSVGTICVGKGGTGGGGAAANSAGNGGAGGIAGTGDITSTGPQGGNGSACNTTTNVTNVASGFGADSIFGGGARGVPAVNGGVTASGVGGGGSGGATALSAAAQAGGAGVKGFVCITEYIAI